MKTFFKIFVLIFVFTSGITMTAYTQTLFIDDFNYPVIDSLNGTGGWFISGLNSPYNIKVVSPGLIYPGYPGSGIGNTAYISNMPNGDICLHNFTTQTTGTIYMSFMIRIDSIGTSATQGYNIGFDEEGGATNHNTKFYIRKVTSATYNLGISKMTSAPVYKNTVYNTFATLFVVLKFSFVSGAANDSAMLFVFTSGVPASEPTPDTSTVSGDDPANIGQVLLSNSYAQGAALQGTVVKIDGIRIGTTWLNTVISTVRRIAINLPGEYNLYQNYPNPFNPVTKIKFDLKEGVRSQESEVKLIIYDITGREVVTLVNEQLQPGSYEVTFDGSNFSSGVYFYRLQAGDFKDTKLMLLVK